ncbi:MAG: M20 family metallopeptidase [Caldilineaceae bacterium]|nr:M20 family metallopeptidase [Caldilineaceae bacterium]
MIHQPLLDYFDLRRPDMLAAIEDLVSRETPSSDKARLDAFAHHYAGRLSAAGADAEIVPCAQTGNHVRARFGYDAVPAADGHALILCHYDTVWPVGSLETHPFRIDGEGKAYGPGIFDMQSSLVMSEFLLHAINDLQLTLKRPVTILATSDEETGSHHSRALIEAEAQGAAYALVLESPLPGGVLKTARKGGGVFVITATGRAAHAGVEPEKGVSAITEIAHQILAVQALADAEEGTTVSVGLVNGGSAHNVIPAQAVAEADVRSWSMAGLDRVSAAIYGLQPVTPGASLAVTGGVNRPPLERSVTAELFARVRAIGEEVGLTLQEGSTGGGSDASWPGLMGVPTLDGLGIPGHGAHADHEHIEVAEIPSRTALLVASLLEL